jgi:hypothetical protein
MSFRPRETCFELGKSLISTIYLIQVSSKRISIAKFRLSGSIGNHMEQGNIVRV